MDIKLSLEEYFENTSDAKVEDNADNEDIEHVGIGYQDNVDEPKFFSTRNIHLCRYNLGLRWL